MEKRINVEFYQLIMPDGCGVLFEQVFDRISSFDLPARQHRSRGVPIRIETTSASAATREGDILKIRMENLPQKVPLNAPAGPLDLSDNEGLGEETAFLYDCALKVLVIQRNQFGVLPSAFARYFSEKHDLEGVIELKLILQEDAMKRLAGMREYRKFIVRIAAPGNAQIFQDIGLSPTSMLELMDEAPRAAVSVDLSMGRISGSLSADGVRRLATELYQKIASRVRKDESYKIKVIGQDVDQESRVIDLLCDRMVETCKIETTGRSIHYTDRKRAVREAWKSRRTELTRILRSVGAP